MNKQTAFQIETSDNVATALCPLEAGEVHLYGDVCTQTLMATEAVPVGHKIALSDIGPGEAIMKYGMPIGCATRWIAKGSWVHLHCMRSMYDERSAHLDPLTGAPMDIRYE